MVRKDLDRYVQENQNDERFRKMLIESHTASLGPPVQENIQFLFSGNHNDSIVTLHIQEFYASQNIQKNAQLSAKSSQIVSLPTTCRNVLPIYEDWTLGTDAKALRSLSIQLKEKIPYYKVIVGTRNVRGCVTLEKKKMIDRQLHHSNVTIAGIQEIQMTNGSFTSEHYNWILSGEKRYLTRRSLRGRRILFFRVSVTRGDLRAASPGSWRGDRRLHSVYNRSDQRIGVIETRKRGEDKKELRKNKSSIIGRVLRVTKVTRQTGDPGCHDMLAIELEHGALQFEEYGSPRQTVNLKGTCTPIYSKSRSAGKCVLATILLTKAASEMKRCSLPNRRLRIKISDLHSCGGDKRILVSPDTCHRL
ncbi:hypothetical protein EVAR_33881_1 [Eumeta japonica]|uniref:Uncharacterized protein n=1 Tax=Eumeta variegata TaxID=151549 RepID=A0A4C1WJV9_EUMVA|nr:hypothetical protein EVAR_33881_1 [Eumeta japonica]